MRCASDIKNLRTQPFCSSANSSTRLSRKQARNSVAVVTSGEVRHSQQVPLRAKRQTRKRRTLSRATKYGLIKPLFLTFLGFIKKLNFLDKKNKRFFLPKRRRGVSRFFLPKRRRDVSLERVALGANLATRNGATD